MNEVFGLIHSLRTIRANNFSKKPVSETDLAEILKAATCAANASNRQSYSIVVPDENAKSALSWPGSKAVLFCVDFNRLSNMAESVNLRFEYQYLMQFVTAVIDCSLAAQTAVLAAKSLGIDSLITNRVYHQDLERVGATLDLPERGCFPLMLVCLGYPLAEPSHKKGRLNELGIVHTGRYQKLGQDALAQLMGAYDNKDKGLTLIDNWAEQGYQHYFEWFCKKWSKKVGTLEMGKKFNEALKKAGFLDDVV